MFLKIKKACACQSFILSPAKKLKPRQSGKGSSLNCTSPLPYIICNNNISDSSSLSVTPYLASYLSSTSSSRNITFLAFAALHHLSCRGFSPALEHSHAPASPSAANWIRLEQPQAGRLTTTPCTSCQPSLLPLSSTCYGPGHTFKCGARGQ